MNPDDSDSASIQVQRLQNAAADLEKNIRDLKIQVLAAARLLNPFDLIGMIAAVLDSDLALPS